MSLESHESHETQGSQESLDTDIESKTESKRDLILQENPDYLTFLYDRQAPQVLVGKRKVSLPYYTYFLVNFSPYFKDLYECGKRIPHHILTEFDIDGDCPYFACLWVLLNLGDISIDVINNYKVPLLCTRETLIDLMFFLRLCETQCIQIVYLIDMNVPLKITRDLPKIDEVYVFILDNEKRIPDTIRVQDIYIEITDKVEVLYKYKRFTGKKLLKVFYIFYKMSGTPQEINKEEITKAFQKDSVTDDDIARIVGDIMIMAEKVGYKFYKKNFDRLWNLHQHGDKYYDNPLNRSAYLPHLEDEYIDKDTDKDTTSTDIDVSDIY